MLLACAMVVSSCIVPGSLDLTAYCDRAKISYVEDGDPGTDTVCVKVVSSGHVAAQKDITTSVANGDQHTVTINYDKKYP